MGWFRKEPSTPGYEDRAALRGFGGYEPADGSNVAPAAPPPVPPPAETSTARPRGQRGQPQQSPFQRGPAGQVPSRDRPPARPTVRRRRPFAPAGFVVFGLVVAGVLVNNAMPDSTVSDSPPPVTSTYTAESPRPSVVVPAVVDGWQPVPGRDGGYAYDVPPSWTPKPSTLHGWEADDANANPGITLAASAFTGEAHCPADPRRDRGGSGVASVPWSDPALAARNAATSVADHAYSTDGGSPPVLAVGSPQPAEVPFGDATREASVVVVEVTPAAGVSPCLPTTALVAALAVTPAEGDAESPVLVAYADQGYPDATGRDDLVRLVTSLRAVPTEDRTTIPATP
ncbi:hypothetical protein SAMN05421810_101205 [Amycolatopsis arida]|uniref:DUF8017 domain-containing protein n=1 Tax=Amycolatopsis arida TaxID=587909 RepID=A0A1I5KKX7_9PSEU|nr:hypothetical protein [Amycolatopsis arida]TDX97101.1 hypothetical protein CLV69_102203 [Amycolatopsis arida]SFO85760.1 hypothetical protein SAMN05421810_101205 [Amycolatopsis arida]